MQIICRRQDKYHIRQRTAWLRGEWVTQGEGRWGEAVQLCVSIFIIFIKNVIMQHVDVCTARKGVEKVSRGEGCLG